MCGELRYSVARLFVTCSATEFATFRSVSRYFTLLSHNVISAFADLTTCGRRNLGDWLSMAFMLDAVAASCSSCNTSTARLTCARVFTIAVPRIRP